MMEKYVNFEN
ncbi:hypothetical protein CFP56_000522 [Quercus suber]|uniref:Uncharacterized protein n=1 Tax=Quercus suber TaxID=58331 RepID=A0AAW0LHB2_QUESU